MPVTVRHIPILAALLLGATPALAQAPAPSPTSNATPPRPAPPPAPPGVLERQLNAAQNPPQISGIATLPTLPADQNGGRRRFRNQDGQGPGPGGFGGRRGFGGFQGQPSGQPPVAGANGPAAFTAPGLALSAPALALPAAGMDITHQLQGAVSVIFDPGAKDARVKLVETDAHGVEGVRYLKPGQVYKDGWKLTGLTPREALLRKGKKTLHVDITRGGGFRPAAIQPAVLTPPPAALPNGAAPGRGGFGLGGRVGPGGPGVRGGRGPNQGGMGLSNAQTGGSPRVELTTVQPINGSTTNPMDAVRAQLAAMGDAAGLAILNSGAANVRISMGPSGTATVNMVGTDGTQRVVTMPPGTLPMLGSPPPR